jgi:hypothetical protein
MIKASNNTIGGTTLGAGNRIAFNGNDGVLVDTGTGNGVHYNCIFGNTGLGIQLVNNGNNSQPYPDLKLAHWNAGDDDEEDDGDGAAGTIKVRGILTGAPNSQFTLEFFINSSPNASGFGEGESFIGSVTVTTDARGRARFVLNLPASASLGRFISATATDVGDNTSQFSKSMKIAGGSGGRRS